MATEEEEEGRGGDKSSSIPNLHIHKVSCKCAKLRGVAEEEKAPKEGEEEEGPEHHLEKKRPRKHHTHRTHVLPSASSFTKLLRVRVGYVYM